MNADIRKALYALGYKNLSRFTAIKESYTVIQVFDNGQYFGRYDTQRQTFVD